MIYNTLYDHLIFIQEHDIIVPFVVVGLLMIVLVLCYKLDKFKNFEFGLLGDKKFTFERRLPMDGFRGYLALIVAYYHSDLAPAYERFYGSIDPFFIISGYVITTVILKAACSNKGFTFAGFYARRFKRLLPSSTIVLLSTVFLYKFIYTQKGLYKYKNSFIAAATYTENLYEIKIKTDYFLKEEAHSPVLQFWSLGVEEQFYLVWPSLLLTINYLCKRSSKLILSIFSISAIMALFISFYSGWDPIWVYFAPQFKIYQLLSGSIIGIFIITFGGKLPQNEILGSILIYFGFTGINLFIGGYLQHTLNLVGFYLSVSAISVIIGLEISNNNYPSIILSTPLFQFIGDISYEIYLWHYPIINIGNIISRVYMPERHLYIESIIELFIIIILAYITRKLSIIIMRIPARDLMVSFVAIFSIFIVIGIIILLCPPPYNTYNNKLDINEQIPTNTENLTPKQIETLEAINKYHDIKTNENVNLENYFNSALYPNVDYIVAFGDSHAGEWTDAFEDLSRKHNVLFQVIWQHGCLWIDGIDIKNHEDCNTLHEKMSLQVKQNPKAVIFFSGMIKFAKLKYYNESSFKHIEDPKIYDIMDYGINYTISQIPNNAPIFIVKHHPVITENFDSELLNLNYKNKIFSISESEKSSKFYDYFDTLPEKFANVHVLSLSDLVCKQGYCNAVENGVFQFRDWNHITNEYAVTIEDGFWDKIKPYLPNQE